MKKSLLLLFWVEKAKENPYSFEMKCTRYLYNLKALSLSTYHWFFKVCK
jgi:hypothetical protein